jgi:putative phage-type endonuclease
MEIVTFIKDIINETKNEYNVKKNEISDVKKYIISLVKSIYDKDKKFTMYILDQLLEDNLEIIDTDIVLPRDNETILIPEDRIADVNHLKYIRELPQPEQRTDEWFQQRKKMLTASTCAQALDENPYRNQSSDHLVLDKVGLGSRFPENIFVHHGKKYEQIATMLYEQLYDVQVEEFGLVPDISCEPKKRFLGASPDGICTQYKLSDRTFSKKLNTMLEIKCPYSRKIKLKGEIDGEICPHYYWCQCQQQLHCCKLDKCDFWQVTLDEFYSEEELLSDPTIPEIYEEQEKQLSFNPNIVQGVIIQLKPLDDYSSMPFKCTYIYPPHLNFTMTQYRKWVLKELSDLSDKHEFRKFKFDKVLYWKAKIAHNACIKYDKKWFDETLIRLRKVWDKVLYYRKNMKEANELKIKLYPKKVYDDAFISSESSEEEVKIVKKKKKMKSKTSKTSKTSKKLIN